MRPENKTDLWLAFSRNFDMIWIGIFLPFVASGDIKTSAKHSLKQEKLSDTIPASCPRHSKNN